jgi:membrane-associated phospholipid phosphatase
MKKLFIAALLLVLGTNIIAQDTLYIKDSAIIDQQGNTVVYLSYADEVKRPSPYKTSWKKDGPITAGLIGLNVLGVYLVNHKKDLTLAELATKTRDKVPFFDRGNIGYYDENIDKASYIPFYVSFGLPVVMMFADGDQTRNLFQVVSLYTETMAVTGALFSITAGAINRSRPLVYNNEAPLEKKLSNNSQRSFYAGHTAATASATFFMAKVFSDMNPDSKLRPVVWVVAAALPALVGYQRYMAGHHFLSDNILGYGLGAAAGILIPHWHKTRKSDKLSLVPQVGIDYRGLAVRYKL